MKFVKYVWLVVALGFIGGSIGFSVMSDSFQGIVNRVSVAIKAGNSKKLRATFAGNLSLSIKRDEGTYTKFQAELLLNDFFRANKIEQVKELQKVNNSSNSFVVYSLKSKGVTYRVFVKFELINRQFAVSELRIE